VQIYLGFFGVFADFTLKKGQKSPKEKCKYNAF